jgi:hypothetical protein
MNDHIYIYWDDVPLANDTKVLHRLEVEDRGEGCGDGLPTLMRAGKKPHNPICDDIRKAIAHLQFELERQDEQQTISATSEGSQTTTGKYAVLY